jgi:outer membrane protein assembly factor BamB
MAVSTSALAADWPQFLGPTRNGIYPGPVLAESWPKEGPPVVWQRKVGQGFSGPTVSGGKLILFHRIDDNEVVECLDAKTGKFLWKTDYPTAYQDDFGFDPGPRATPTLMDGRVYTFGAEGTLNCWNLDDGRNLWRIETKKQFGARKGFFGMACSPLVESNAVIVNLGGRTGAGAVAFAKASGQVLWKVTDDEASYASPIAATIGGRRYVFVVTREALMALSPADGRVVFRYGWRPPMHASVSAATPLVIDDLIFISASYGTGASLLRFKESGPEKIWSTDEVLSNHYATSVQRDGFLYGWDGRQEQGCDLRCVELKTGKVRWTESGLGAGTVTLAGDQLLVLTEKGELLRAPVTPAGFKPTGRAQILPFVVRAHPALADGLFYARSKDTLVCVDLRPTP